MRQRGRVQTMRYEYVVYQQCPTHSCIAVIGLRFWIWVEMKNLIESLCDLQSHAGYWLRPSRT